MQLLKFKRREFSLSHPYQYIFVWWLLCVLTMLAFYNHADAKAVVQDNTNLCASAIMQAKTDSPKDILMGVALTETGRKKNGQFQPWPWSINAEGKGWWFETMGEAIEQVKALQASGIKSIDVGCMQINLRWHKDAFTSLEEAFNPFKNVQYAADNMAKNYSETKNWLLAAGRHHSFREDHAKKYREKVIANLEATATDLMKGKYINLDPSLKDRFTGKNRDKSLSSGPFIAFNEAPKGGLLRTSKGPLIQLGQERGLNLFSRVEQGG